MPSKDSRFRAQGAYILKISLFAFATLPFSFYLFNGVNGVFSTVVLTILFDEAIDRSRNSRNVRFWLTAAMLAVIHLGILRVLNIPEFSPSMAMAPLIVLDYLLIHYVLKWLSPNDGFS
jgi:hypothetical protein